MTELACACWAVVGSPFCHIRQATVSSCITGVWREGQQWLQLGTPLRCGWEETLCSRQCPPCHAEPGIQALFPESRWQVNTPTR